MIPSIVVRLRSMPRSARVRSHDTATSNSTESGRPQPPHEPPASKRTSTKSSSLLNCGSATFSHWNKLPREIKVRIFKHHFQQATSTYLFAPGQQKPYKFVITNSTHINLLFVSRQTWKEGHTIYFSTAKIVLRGYERYMHESVPQAMRNLCHNVIELNLPLHFVRWMLLRQLQRWLRNGRHCKETDKNGGSHYGFEFFPALQKLVMEDMSYKGFEFQSDLPDDEEMLTTLFRQDTELTQIHDLLTINQVVSKELEIVFHFEVLHCRSPLEPAGDDIMAAMSTGRTDKRCSMSRIVRFQQNSTSKVTTTAIDNVEGENLSDDHDSNLNGAISDGLAHTIGVQSVSAYVLDLRTKALQCNGTRLKIKKI